MPSPFHPQIDIQQQHRDDVWCSCSEHLEADAVCVRKPSWYLTKKVVFGKKCKEREEGYYQNELLVSDGGFLGRPVIDSRL